MEERRKHSRTETDDEGTLELAQIKTYGETCHTFVSRRRYHGRLLEPGYGVEDLPPEPAITPSGTVAMNPRLASSKSARSENGSDVTKASLAARVAGSASFDWACSG